MKSIYIAYIVIVSYTLHPNGIIEYDTVSKNYNKFHITMFCNKEYKQGDVVKAGFKMNIPDSLISSKSK